MVSEEVLRKELVDDLLYYTDIPISRDEIRRASTWELRRALEKYLQRKRMILEDYEEEIEESEYYLEHPEEWKQQRIEEVRSDLRALREREAKKRRIERSLRATLEYMDRKKIESMRCPLCGEGELADWRVKRKMEQVHEWIVADYPRKQRKLLNEKHRYEDMKLIAVKDKFRDRLRTLKHNLEYAEKDIQVTKRVLREL